MRPAGRQAGEEDALLGGHAGERGGGPGYRHGVFGVDIMRAEPSGRVTGIFYHPSFSRRSYLTTGRRLADFPDALAPLLRQPQVRLLECPTVTDDLIHLAHDPGLIPRVEADPL
jgi:hypothetical protein